MPAPRALPTQRARKSHVPDPDLYGDPASSDSDSHPAPPARKRSKPAPIARRGSKGPQPTRGSVTTDTGRRRSSRLSAEGAHASPDAPSAAAGSTAAPASRATAHPADDPPRPASRSKQPVKGKKRPPQADPDPGPPASDDSDSDPSAPARVRPSRPASKRPRLAPDPDRDDARDEDARAPVASGSGQATAPAPRRGFVPRAVADLAKRVDKPPPQYSTVLVDAEADEVDPFPFTTNPPTPHAKAQPRRNAAAKGKEKAPRIARQTLPHPSSEDHTPDSAAPIPAASGPARRKTTPPRAQQKDGAAALTVHETPVQVRNIAFRAGAGPGTPMTAVRAGSASARRSSVRGSGKRGSSIGGGFDAVPHPQVADDKLYRSTDASDPLAKRLRAILSWASQRTRGRVLAHDAGGDSVQQAAKDVLDGWVEDVCRLRVDTSVPFSEPTTAGASHDSTSAGLPPHPQNVGNGKRLVELEAAYAAIAQEQAARHALEPAYQSFLDRRAAALALPVPSRAWTEPAAYARALDTKGEAVLPDGVDAARALGRRVLAGVLSLPTPVPPAPDASVSAAQTGTALLAHTAHRLAAFVRVVAAYVAKRGRETHDALLAGTMASALGPAARAGAGAGAAAGAGTVGTAEAEALSRALGGGGVGPGAGAGAVQVDPRELLRAIAGADAAR